MQYRFLFGGQFLFPFFVCLWGVLFAIRVLLYSFFSLYVYSATVLDDEDFDCLFFNTK